ncbi:MAG TPA: NACHT domain-containing protein [Longimicrobium sp.]
MPDFETVKSIASVATPFTNAIVETWLKPALIKLLAKYRTDRELIQNSFASKFQDYLDRAYERHSYLNVLVFQNQRKLLEELYIPMRIQRDRMREAYLIDDYPPELLERHSRVLIRDTAGMGKSTMLKFLFLATVRRNIGIPVFVELRKLSSQVDLIEFVITELSPVGETVDRNFVIELLTRGHFIFFLDGYDEVPLAEREPVTHSLQQFIAKLPDNFFVMASRPEAALATFSDFVGFDVLPLLREEAFALIRKYDTSGEISSRLIAALQEPHLESVSDFLENPLLVSLLFKSYEYKPRIPFKKHIFYRQVFDALFETHDLTKPGAFIREKHSGLDIEEFHRVLRSFSFLTVKLRKVAYSRDEIVRVLTEAAKYSQGIKFRSSDFLQDLLTTVPLFVRDGSEYRWSHKSLQEYFAACFICLDAKEREGEILRKMISDDSGRYLTVLDLCYDLDFPSFRANIIYPLAKQFVSHINSVYCGEYGSVSYNAIAIRKTMTFHRSIVFGPHDILKASVEEISSRSGVPLPPKYQPLYGSELSKKVFVFSYGSHSEAELFDLLRTKGNEIFCAYDWTSEEDVSAVMAVEPVVRGIGKPVLLTDDPIAPFNSPELFSHVNTLIRGLDVGIWFDPLACQNIVFEFESEGSLEDSNIDLLSGL